MNLQLVALVLIRRITIDSARFRFVLIRRGRASPAIIPQIAFCYPDPHGPFSYRSGRFERGAYRNMPLSNSEHNQLKHYR